jgi:hypothetical protein
VVETDSIQEGQLQFQETRRQEEKSVQLLQEEQGREDKFKIFEKKGNKIELKKDEEATNWLEKNLCIAVIH